MRLRYLSETERYKKRYAFGLFRRDVISWKLYTSLPANQITF